MIGSDKLSQERNVEKGCVEGKDALKLRNIMGYKDK